MIGDEILSELTLQEYLEQQRELELRAAKLLPHKFDKCTAFLGNISQTIYSCLTCLKNDELVRGYCYACSISCHGEHDIVELGIRRNFCCDCSVKCKLKSEPLAMHDNVYNSTHNFKGVFCSCQNVFVAEEDQDQANDINEYGDEERSTMFQCIVCEDWFHDRCLNDLPSNLMTFDDFMCMQCVQKIGDIDSLAHIEANTNNRFNLYLSGPWKDRICRCKQCIEHLQNNSALFLLTEQTLYEPETDTQASESLYDLGIKALSLIPPNQVALGLKAIKHIKNKISQRLKEIELENRSVTVEDIHKIFELLEQNRSLLSS